MGQWLEQKIIESRYNDKYKNSASTRSGVPDYLLKKGEEENQKIIARCSNEEERN